MSGTNHNMNHIVKRIETRVLAPPGGFSSISFGSEASSGEKFRDHDFNPKNRNMRFPREKGRTDRTYSGKSGNNRDKPPRDTRGTQGKHRQIDSYSNGKENRVKTSCNRERRDSLDELIDNPQKPTSRSSERAIPGLESHYSLSNSLDNSDEGSMKNSYRAISPIDTSCYSRGRIGQSLKKDDYAEILRQQIATKKNLVDEDGFEHHRYSTRRTSQSTNSLFSGDSRNRSSVHGNEAENKPAGIFHDATNRRHQYGAGGGRSSLSLSWE